MLRDLIEFAQNPYPWHLAPMGYVREARLIAKRARDLEPAWSGHIQATRRCIEASVDLCRRRRTVVVVGSGALLDVPLDVLGRAFDRVVLLDIFHTRATRRAVRKRSNVVLLPTDVTGVVRRVFVAARRRAVGRLPKSDPPVLDVRDVDLIISVNLLSQLGVIPCNFLKGHHPAIPPAQLDAFTRDLIDAHLRWLVQSAERVCLITDVERTESLTGGAVIRKDIVAGVDLPRPDDMWDWRIAPLGGIYSDREVTHHVHAFRDFRPGDGRITCPPEPSRTEAP